MIWFNSLIQLLNETKRLGYCEGTSKQILKKKTKRSKKVRLASTSIITKSLPLGRLRSHIIYLRQNREQPINFQSVWHAIQYQTHTNSVFQYSIKNQSSNNYVGIQTEIVR